METEPLPIKVLILVPAYNEEQTLRRTIEETQKATPFADLLVIDDGSVDRTAAIARGMGVLVISHIVNLGIGAAVQTGFKYALTHGYVAAVQIDGDGQHDPKYLKGLVSKFVETQADIVIGSRYLDSNPNLGRQDSVVRSAGIHFFSRLASACTGQRITDCSSGLRLVSEKTLALFSVEYPVDFPDAEALILAGRRNLRIVEMPVIFRKRQGGRSNLSFLRMLYYPLKELFSILILLLRGD